MRFPYFSKPATGVLKFHGIYQQDDRDLRKLQPERAFSAMVRVGIPGGRLSAEQYLELDRLADEVGDGTLRITSRQALQYHHVSKRSLPELISRLHTHRSDHAGRVRRRGSERGVLRGADYLRRAAGPEAIRNGTFARTQAAYTGVLRDLAQWRTGGQPGRGEQDPLYGETYLPRKFKIGFAYEGENTTDIYSHDLGFVAHFDRRRARRFHTARGRQPGTEQRRTRQPSPAGRSDWVRAAGTAAGDGKGGSIDSPRFRQPREPSAGTLEVRDRGVGRGAVPS